MSFFFKLRLIFVCKKRQESISSLEMKKAFDCIEIEEKNVMPFVCEIAIELGKPAKKVIFFSGPATKAFQSYLPYPFAIHFYPA